MPEKTGKVGESNDEKKKRFETFKLYTSYYFTSMFLCVCLYQVKDRIECFLVCLTNTKYSFCMEVQCKLSSSRQANPYFSPEDVIIHIHTTIMTE